MRPLKTGNKHLLKILPLYQMDVSDDTEDIYFARLTFNNDQDDILNKLKIYNINGSDLETYFYDYLTVFAEYT